MIKTNNFIKNIGKLSVDRFDFEKHVTGESLDHESKTIKVNPILTINNNICDNIRSCIIEFKSIIDKGFSIHPAYVGDSSQDLGLIKISGDIDGTYDNIKVVGLSGTKLGEFSTGTLVTNDVLSWDGYKWVPSQSFPIGSAGGDLQGTYPNPQVKDLTMTGEVKGSILSRNATNWFALNGTSSTILRSSGSGNNISFQSKNGLTPNSPAGGDLTGFYPNPTIASNVLDKNTIQNLAAKTLLGTTTTSTSATALSFGNGIRYNNLTSAIELSKTHMMCVEEHFLIDSYINYNPTLFSSGTTAFVAGGSTEFSSVLISSTASILSGAALKTQNVFRLSGGESYVCRFKLGTSNSGITNILGFFLNDITSNRKLCLSVSGLGVGSVQIQTSAGLVSTGVNTGFSVGVYYTVELIVKSNISGIICKIYNSSGTLLELINFNTGGDLFSENLCAGVASQISSATAAPLIYVDYICATKYLGNH